MADSALDADKAAEVSGTVLSRARSDLVQVWPSHPRLVMPRATYLADNVGDCVNANVGALGALTGAG
jgi:hypothetical protein